MALSQAAVQPYIEITWRHSMSLLDPKWKYTHSTATDIRKTFAKARKALAQQQKAAVRPGKLHLMCSPSESASAQTFGSHSTAKLFGTRGMPGESTSDQNDEVSGVRRVMSERRLA
jgi:hypothetical protein